MALNKFIIIIIIIIIIINVKLGEDYNNSVANFESLKKFLRFLFFSGKAMYLLEWNARLQERFLLKLGILFEE